MLQIEACCDFIHPFFLYKSVLPPFKCFSISMFCDFVMYSDEKVTFSINKTVHLLVFLCIQNNKMAAF
jgi:hypothetical protein